MIQRFDYATLAPEGMKALAGVRTYVNQCGLSPELVEMVYLRVSLINGCAYCIDMHGRALRQAGMSPEKLALVPVWAEAGGLFTPRERAALRWAETVTGVAQTHIPDADYAAVVAELSPKEIADLTIVIGLMNAYNRIAIASRKLPDSAAG